MSVPEAFRGISGGCKGIPGSFNGFKAVPGTLQGISGLYQKVPGAF